mmetsp:Transcript_2956/g.5250  ORF Transcript_2956/g.5250 Transcript_2956/m.5250 type:complete len:279 (+) Transcript_2956:1094-1930(+)|eukprot:CAMPEP_0171492244 /NCGR_PEP_ID=MMETSP0958-20121227/4304_1 /TAXON_ID=87120 /ORGANISM="Aurantiochytrium limacinum, Strain ATCCMYA-1381" /LENGTH=278 /DNA_ID=CAMNT_0012025745 /DNA_START=1021 /DNA_END=1857 /DNA_ORIENTATION=+
MAAARLLALDLLRAPAPASTLLVYTPGIASSRVGAKSDAFQALAEKLSWDFVRYDLVGHGESEGSLMDLSVTGTLQDLQQIIRDTQRDESQRLFLAGASFGGYISCLAAREMRASERVVGLASLGGAYYFPKHMSKLAQRDASSVILPSNYVDGGEIVLSTNLVQDAQDYPCGKTLGAQMDFLPMYMLHGEGDEVVSEPDASAFFDAYVQATLEHSAPRGVYQVVAADQGGDHRVSSPEPLARFVAAIGSQFGKKITPSDIQQQQQHHQPMQQQVSHV